ncbi:hypothetical protein E4T66_12490 [Sinimarinibacterium sp. CAU 1509]|uniref:hypothetical protein n=1 Tax=Sinimarinibacterium sp. CAU 1509 TaxID=2562283 RepID=UPI0010AB8F12|nr:hypothetical protein [Sinimarinibacterium sp. CAU 1509]TJY59994.1 hypothetical protein E4T66_12490 [Sinimarinibacterium sp. CAU 1509]
MSVASMLWSVLFGSIGFGYFLYGKKQAAMVPLVCGLLLMVFPFGVSNPYWMVAVGATLMAIPYFYRS